MQNPEIDATNRPASVRVKKRQTVASNYYRGLGPVPGLLTRRLYTGVMGLAGFPTSFMSGLTAAQIENPLSFSSLSSFGQLGVSPLRVLTYLYEISPPIAYSCDLNLRLAIPPDGLKIVGGVANPDGTGFEQDDKATAIIDNLFKSLPDEVGGLHGLQTTLMLTTMFAGMACVEAVPYTDFRKGVARIWPVDPLTMEFSRPNPRADVIPWQRQLYYAGLEGAITAAATSPLLSYPNLKEINPNTFFWRALDTWPDSPYGNPVYSTALPEVLLQLSIMKDLKDSVHANAWPRTAFGFNFKNASEIAAQVYKMNQEQAKEYVAQEFQNLIKYLNAKNPDDDYAYDSEGEAKVLSAGDYSSLPAILDYMRMNLFYSMKELPAMMGIDASNADSYNTISWLVKTSRLENLRVFSTYPLEKSCDLHFRLTGTKYIARAIYEPLRGADELIKAQADGQKAKNEVFKRDEGLQSQQETAVKVTGSKNVQNVPLTWQRPKINDNNNSDSSPDSKPDGNNAGQDEQAQKATRRANKSK